MNSFFNWLKDTGTQAMLVLAGTCAAIVAAVATIYFGKKSLTKKDIEGVEENTAHLEDVRSNIASVDSRLKKQEEAQQVKIGAYRVSITARGYQSGNVPLDLLLSVKQPQEHELILTHLELCNEYDNQFGSFPCSRIGDPNGLSFRAAIPMENMAEWFRGGTPDPKWNGRRLKLRVWMSTRGVDVSRDMAVTVHRPDPGSRYPTYDVQGSV